jgi:uncharacterized protein (DUF433 family)
MRNAKPSELAHRSFRLRRRLLTELKRVAAQRRTSQTALVERYLEEGLKLDAYPMIVFRDSPVGRRPMLEGTRLDVAQVVDTVRNEGGSVEAACDYLSLSSSQVRACVHYYADNKDEVDAYADRVEEENERLRVAWERERELLTG